VFAARVDFYNNKQFLLVAENRGGKKASSLVELDVPSDARTTFLRDKLLIELRSDWKLPKPKPSRAAPC
jgi:hypothetical protein